MEKVKYSFKGKVWLYSGGASSWHFITLPKTLSREIDSRFFGLKKGFGSLPVKVTLGSTEWETSIFPDKKNGSFILPLKAEIRKKEKFGEGSSISLLIEI
jgi:hypothetical protein